MSLVRRRNIVVVAVSMDDVLPVTTNNWKAQFKKINYGLCKSKRTGRQRTGREREKKRRSVGEERAGELG